MTDRYVVYLVIVNHGATDMAYSPTNNLPR